MKSGFKKQAAGKLAFIGIYIMLAIFCGMSTAVDITHPNAPVGISVVDASLSGLWLLVAILEIKNYRKWRKLVLNPDAVTFITADYEGTITGSPTMKHLADILVRHRDLFSDGKLSLSITTFDPTKERVESNVVPLEEYTINDEPTVTEKSPS